MAARDLRFDEPPAEGEPEEEAEEEKNVKPTKPLEEKKKKKGFFKMPTIFKRKKAPKPEPEQDTWFSQIEETKQENEAQTKKATFAEEEPEPDMLDEPAPLEKISFRRRETRLEALKVRKNSVHDMHAHRSAQHSAIH